MGAIKAGEAKWANSWCAPHRHSCAWWQDGVHSGTWVSHMEVTAYPSCTGLRGHQEHQERVSEATHRVWLGIGPKEQRLRILSQRSKEALSLCYLPRNLSPAEPARVKHSGKASTHCSTQTPALAGVAHCKPLLLRRQNWVPQSSLRVTQQSLAKPAPGQSLFSHHTASENSFDVHNQCALTRGGPWKRVLTSIPRARFTKQYTSVSDIIPPRSC